LEAPVVPVEILPQQSILERPPLAVVVARAVREQSLMSEDSLETTQTLSLIRTLRVRF
jgi:hypothetical protein